MNFFKKLFSFFYNEERQKLSIIQKEDPDILIREGIFCKEINGFFTVQEFDNNYFDPLFVKNCEFTFSDIFILNGVVVGQNGSQVYQLNSDGIPVSNGQHPEYFEPLSTLLEVGESDYFELYAEKTEQVGDRFVLGDELSVFFGVKEHLFCALFNIFDKNYEPVIYKGKQLAVHEVYLENGKIIAEIGNTQITLNHDGYVI